MLLSLSAKYDQLSEFDWYTYKGARGTTLVNQTGRVILRVGDKFGLNAMRGGRYRVVLPGSYRSEFRLEGQEADNLIAKARKIPMPSIENLEKPRSLDLAKHSQSKDFRKWDSDYFKAARAVNGESKTGIDFSNYQWRKVNTGETLNIVSTKLRKLRIQQRTLIGVRFIKPAVGGILIDLDGHRISLSSSLWEEMLAKTTVQPKNKWPEGKFTPDQLVSARDQELEILRSQKRDAAQARREEERARTREREEAKARERERRKIERERAKKDQEKAIADRLEAQRLKDSVVKPVEHPDDRILKYYRDLRAKEREKALEDVNIDYDDDTLDADFDLDAPDDIDDQDDDLDIDADASVADDAIDPVDLLETVVSERRGRIKIDLSSFGDGEYDEDDGEDVEDTGDIDYDDEEDDSDDDSDEDYDQVIDDADYEDYDEDAASAEDELDAIDEDDDTEEDPEEESAPYEAVEGDVVEFREDSSSNREFLILDIYPFSQNNKITIYKLYDLTNEPESFQTVRINTTQKRRFEDMVEFVSKMDETEFNRYLALTDGYQRSAEPIVS